MYWFNKSQDLWGVIHALRFAIRHQDEMDGGESGYSYEVAAASVMPMLCGMALELMYKAICVAKGLKVPETHELSLLADRGGAQLSDDDKRYLRYLSIHVWWEGRYPVPKEMRADEMDELSSISSDLFMEDVPGVSIRLRRHNGRDQEAMFDDLWGRAASAFHANHVPTE
ncbi:hypothetical protein [Pandoraea sp.]|uniref:hypothetical protein n=1 Tax=Pandoraea sp. TaxID=1883445 RepID=UPI0035B1D55A